MGRHICDLVINEDWPSSLYGWRKAIASAPHPLTQVYLAQSDRGAQVVAKQAMRQSLDLIQQR